VAPTVTAWGTHYTVFFPQKLNLTSFPFFQVNLLTFYTHFFLSACTGSAILLNFDHLDDTLGGL
jgi:hypothetical protein